MPRAICFWKTLPAVGHLPTIHNAILKICPKFQVLSSHWQSLFKKMCIEKIFQLQSMLDVIKYVDQNVCNQEVWCNIYWTWAVLNIFNLQDMTSHWQFFCKINTNSLLNVSGESKWVGQHGHESYNFHKVQKYHYSMITAQGFTCESRHGSIWTSKLQTVTWVMNLMLQFTKLTIQIMIASSSALMKKDGYYPTRDSLWGKNELQ